MDLTTPEQDDGGLIMGQMVKKFDISRRTSFVASNPITPITPATLISTVPDTSITTPASRNVSVIYHDSESIKPKKSINTNNNSNSSTPDKKHDNNKSKSNKSKSNGVNNGFKNAIKNKPKNGHSKRKAKHAIKTSVSNGEFPETHKIQLLNEYSGSHSTNNGDNITETKEITYDSDNSNSQSDSVPPLLSHSHSAQTSKQKKKAINNSHNAYFEQSKRQTKSNPNSTRSQQINNRNNINVNVNNLLNTQMYYGDIVTAPNMNDHPFIHQLTNQRKSSLPILPQQNQTIYHSNHSNHSNHGNGFFGHNNNIKNNNNNNQNNQMPFVQDFQQFRPKTHRPIIGFDNNIIHTNMPQMSQSTRIINDMYKSQPLIHTQSQPSFNPMILGAPPNMSDEDINNIQSKQSQSRAVYRAASQNKMLKPHNNYDRNHNNNNDNDGHWPKMFAQVPQLDQWVNASQSTRESQYSRMIRTKKILRNYEKKIKHTGRSVVTPNSTRVSNSIYDSNPYLDQSNFIKHKHNNNFNDIPEYIPTKQNNNNQYIPIHHHINNKPSKRRPVSQQFIKQQNGSSPYNDYIIKNRYIKNNNDNDNIMYYKKQQNGSKKIRKHIIEPDNDLLIKNHSRNGYINQDY